MKLISETLGHSSERVTSDVYVKTRPTAHVQAAAAISEAIWAVTEATG
jgi:integrase